MTSATLLLWFVFTNEAANRADVVFCLLRVLRTTEPFLLQTSLTRVQVFERGKRVSWNGVASLLDGPIGGAKKFSHPSVSVELSV
jgi:hypothetical protein